MVIVMLNLGKQGPNQLKVWGKYSEQIHDYVERGLMEKVQTPTGTQLWQMVDPYTYRDRLTKPKLLINGTNDRYWTLDAIDLYWDGLKGPKYLVELPNAGHGLDQEPGLGDQRSWGPSSGRWSRIARSPGSLGSSTHGKPGEATLTIHADPAPKSARLWTAHSATRDFREARWESTPMKPGATIAGSVRTNDDGRLALFGELEYQVDGIPYHLTTTFFEPGITPHKDARVRHHRSRRSHPTKRRRGGAGPPRREPVSLGHTAVAASQPAEDRQDDQRGPARDHRAGLGDAGPTEGFSR